MSELTPLGEVVGRYGLDARKALGQHFLLDETVCARIARLPGDLEGRHVLEVGPGPGGLTRALLAAPIAHLTAVELDARALVALAEVEAAFPGRLTVLQQDAMTFDGTTLPTPRQVVANLPYNVGTPLLIGWLRQAGAWERMTLMFQEEVALRIVAPPRTEHYGRLAVLAQWVAHCAIGLRLPPGAFRPPPKVHSAVVVVTPHAEQPAPELFRAMERVTAAAFGQRRKMLRGSLKALGSAEALLAACGIAGERRAEELSVSEFDALARVVAERPA
ncbi:16S rRNA (adenine(1518)-N(6)/adenine(1519)-N(6))-dimethyltransferase RsmA [Roseococcus pinisoli]|uniref:Ribosomal RNA small subunit methyltransferase A n=1 Tax=Roseococcus pinisoli TaxID=2835040 RepID=A0ABS5Q7U5_9PROT|nr:16S rRNA (adenine(1518)-N(6)/adenine(1519)-N(6))-dimethyltransferase RsmA [Roseococcus pinisoli]